MDVRLKARARNRAGVFTRSEALEAGLRDETIQRNVRTGLWRRLRRGVYVEMSTWQAASTTERHRLAACAVSLRCGADLVFSHVTGAVLRDWPVWGVGLDDVRVTRRGPHQTSRSEAGIIHHMARLPDEHVESVDGLLVCSKERLMTDIARSYGFEEAVVMCDAALRDGASREAAQALMIEMYAWPLARGAVAAIRFADGRAESVGESRLRVRLHEEGLIGFVPQLELRSRRGRLLGRGDLVDPEHGVLLEFDGRMKYGIDGQDPGRQVWREKLREDAIREELGYEVVRVRWLDLERPAQLADRVRRAMARASGTGRAAA